MSCPSHDLVRIATGRLGPRASRRDRLRAALLQDRPGSFPQLTGFNERFEIRRALLARFPAVVSWSGRRDSSAGGGPREAPARVLAESRATVAYLAAPKRRAIVQHVRGGRSAHAGQRGSRSQGTARGRVKRERARRSSPNGGRPTTRAAARRPPVLRPQHTTRSTTPAKATSASPGHRVRSPAQF